MPLEIRRVAIDLTALGSNLVPSSVYLPSTASQITLSSNGVSNIGNTCYANIVYTSSSTNISGSRSLRVKMSGNVSKSNFIDTIRLDLTKEG